MGKKVATKGSNFFGNRKNARPQTASSIQDPDHSRVIELLKDDPGFPPQKLRIALDFLDDLRQSNEDVSDELLYLPGFMKEYRQAKEDIRTGRTISWEDIKRDV